VEERGGWKGRCGRAGRWYVREEEEGGFWVGWDEGGRNRRGRVWKGGEENKGCSMWGGRAGEVKARMRRKRGLGQGLEEKWGGVGKGGCGSRGGGGGKMEGGGGEQGEK